MKLFYYILATHSVCNLTKRRTLLSGFSRQTFENEWLWTTASAQSKDSCLCNVIRFFTIKILFNILITQEPVNDHVRTFTLYRISVTMRPLEIPTQRIFNHLIKQNQKLGYDPVLNLSTTVSSSQRQESKVHRTESSVQHLRPD